MLRMPHPTTPPGMRTPDQNVTANIQEPAAPVEDDPLLVAARNEGIDTRGKTRSEIAAELSFESERLDLRPRSNSSVLRRSRTQFQLCDASRRGTGTARRSMRVRLVAVG